MTTQALTFVLEGHISPDDFAILVAQALGAAGSLKPGEGVKCPTNPSRAYTVLRTT